MGRGQHSLGGIIMIPNVGKNFGNFRERYPNAAHDCTHLCYNEYWIIRDRMFSDWDSCHIDLLSRPCDGRCEYYEESFFAGFKKVFKRLLFGHDVKTFSK